MKTENKSVKVCSCGRIITDPKNKTNLCPKCQKNANTVLSGTGLATIVFVAKKYGPKLVQSAGNFAKKIRK